MPQKQVTARTAEDEAIDFLMGAVQEPPASAPAEPAMGPFEATPVQRARAKKDAASAPGELKTDFLAEAQRAAGPKEKTEAQRIEDAQVDELFQLFGREDPSLETKFLGGVARGEALAARGPELAFKARDFGLRKAAEHLRKLPLIGEDLARGIGVTREMLNRWSPFTRKLAQDLDVWGKETEALVNQVDDPRFARQDLLSQVARGAGSTIPFAAVSGPLGLVAGPGIATIAQGLMGMAQMAVPMYEDVLAETGSEEKAWAAAGVGAGLGLTDALGVGRIFAKLDRATGGAMRKVLDRIALGFVEEGFQEGGQTVGESVTRKVLTGKEIRFLDELAQGGESAFVGGIVGGGTTALHEAAGAVSEGVREQPRLERVKKPGEAKLEEEALEPRYIEMFQPGGRGATGMAPTETEAPPAAPKKGEKKRPETEDEVVEAIKAGEELTSEELQRFPGALGRAAGEAIEAEEEQITPGASELAPGEEGEAQAEPSTATEAVQKPAGTAEAPGVPAEEKVARWLSRLAEHGAREMMAEGLADELIEAEERGETTPSKFIEPFFAPGGAYESMTPEGLAAFDKAVERVTGQKVGDVAYTIRMPDTGEIEKGLYESTREIVQEWADDSSFGDLLADNKRLFGLFMQMAQAQRQHEAGENPFTTKAKKLPPEEIEREIEEGIRGMQEIEGEVRRGTAAAISPEMAKESEESFIDDMTGLPNDRADKRGVTKMLRERQPGTEIGRFELDVDDFKAINDLLGRDVGDELIRAIGRKWAGALRESDDVQKARISGDEYGATLPLASRADAPGIRDRLEALAMEAIREQDLDEVAGRKIGASVGFAFAEPGEDYEKFKARTSKEVKARKLERAGGVETPRITTAQVEELGEAAREEYAKKRAAREKTQAKAELEERGEQVPGGAFGEEPEVTIAPVPTAEKGPDARISPQQRELRQRLDELRDLLEHETDPGLRRKYRLEMETLEAHVTPVVTEPSGRAAPVSETEAGPEEAPGAPPKPSRPTDKAGEEDLEAQSVRGARVLIQSARLAGSSAQDVFDTLLADYQEQPKLRQRTSTSKEMQQFSTPLPLAWAASQLAGIEPGSSVYEPTAGHGALLIDATPSTSHANELDPARAARLRGQGFDVHEEDATTHVPPGKYDVVIANPPFGSVKDDQDKAKLFRAPMDPNSTMAWIRGFTTRQIDHAIVTRALGSMKDDGRAVLLISGKKPFGDQSEGARTEAYRSLEDQRFFKALYETYRVTDHFTVPGKLYDRMGAAWPIDVIVIEGRVGSQLDPPFVKAPRILETWDDVRNLLSSDRLAPPRVEPGPDRGERAEPGPADTGSVPVLPAGETPRGARKPRTQEGARTPRGPREPKAPVGGATAVPAAEPTAGGVAGVDREGRPERERDREGSEEGGLAEERPGRVGDDVATEPLHGGAPGVADEVAAGRARGLERANEFQSTYRPKSKQTPVGTLVPLNMQIAMDRALAAIEKTHGDIDAFVAKKLGYTDAELAESFSAEQVDAIALAISNVDRGAGFVIGDQTGVGKGRIVAGMLRYAKRRGLIPVFVTAKPGLYADMRRDLHDIGMPKFRQFVTNPDLTGENALVLDDSTRPALAGQRIESLPKSEYQVAIDEFLAAAREQRAPKNYDAVFTTYDQQNPVAGGRTLRNQFLKAIAPRAMVVLDESHLAGGTEQKGFFFNKEGDAILKATRADFFREIVADANGVVYSSATYAKNPHVMSLYIRTDMGLAVEKPGDLAPLVTRGKVPLQQVIASMLVESGQYVRREKSFEGISMELDVATTSRADAERATEVLRAIFDFDLLMKPVRDAFLARHGASGGGVGAGDSAVGGGGAQTAGFSSVMHNVIAQMLLSLKAKEVGRKAVAMLKSGDPARGIPPSKPIIALSNTMEGLLKDYADAVDAKQGDVLEGFDFARVFQRYLERTREIPVRGLDGKVTRRRIEDEDMGALLGLYQQVEGKIADAGLEGIPGSPLDAIIAEMEAGGLKVGEITGRELRVKYEGGEPILASRTSSDAAKKRAMKGYNNGQLDALVINQAGSTGYSMHASPKNGEDARPRHMFVVQADPNIDVFMQMLGRINRTGQTSLPSYTVVVSDLPSEKRPAAILMRKMASLNANTSASRTSAVSLKNVTDFMNEFGEQSVAEVLRAEIELSSSIGFDEDAIKALLTREGLARKATGYLPLLKIEEQEQLLAAIEGNYQARLEEARAMGENTLEAEVQDIKAKTLERRVLKEGSEGGSPFTRPAYLDKVEATRMVKPLAWEAMQVRAKKMLDVEEGADLKDASFLARKRMAETVDAAVKKATEHAAAEHAKLEKSMAAAREAIPEGAPADDPSRGRLHALEDQAARIKARGTKQRLQGEAIKERLLLLNSRSVEIENKEGEVERGWLVGIEEPRKKANPLAPSNWTLVVVAEDGSHYLRYPISRLMDDEGVEIRRSRDELGPNQFKGAERSVLEHLWIVTGNLLAGFDAMSGNGQVTFYTTDKGDLGQGIILKRGTDPIEILEGKAVRLSPSQAIEYLDREGGEIAEEDGKFKVVSQGKAKPFKFSAKTKGGKPYYLHKGVRRLVGDWKSVRGEKEWEVEVDRDDVVPALNLFVADLGMTLLAKENLATAREITGQQIPKDPSFLMAFPGSIMPDVRAALDALAKKLGYIRQQKVMQAGTIPTETGREKFIRKWQDTFRGVKTLQAKTLEEGGEITDATDAYLGEELRRGKTKKRLELLNEQHFKPLLRGLRADGISPEEAGEVLMARAAPARNALILARDPDNDAGSGFTDDEAAEILDTALAGKRAEGFRRLFERFDAMIEATRAGWVKDGLKSQDEVDQLAKDHPLYAPMRSDLSEDSDEADRPPPSRGVEVRGKEFKTALGRRSKAEASHVLAYAFTQAELGAIRGEKNRVMRRFLNFLRANVELLEGFAKIRPAPVKRALVNGVVKNVYDPTFKFADNVVVIHENGKPILVEIDKDYQNVADALKNLGAENLGALTRLAGAFNRKLAALFTRYSLVFPMFNAIRDAGAAFIGSQEHGMGFALQTVRDIPRSLWTLTRGKLGVSPAQTKKVQTAGGTVETGPITQAKWDRFREEYEASGAPVSFLDLSSFIDMLRRIEKDTRAQSTPGTLGMVRRNWQNLKAMMDAIADVVENSTRFSAYVHAREDLGMTRERAASWSKNLTVNFERRGERGAVMNAWYLFLNAHIQSTARVGQALKHPAVKKLLAVGFVGLMVWDQIMRVVGGKDADGEDCWDKIPSWEKRHNFIIMYPAAGGACGRHVNIPAPFVYEWVQTLAFQLSGSITGDIKPGKALGETLSAFVDSFNPLGGAVDLSNPTSILHQASPTATDLAVELGTNRDYKGDPIGPEDYGGNTPDSERFWPDKASATSIALTRWLNQATGGDEFEKGMIDVSPHTLDHIAGFLTGGLGRDLHQVAELGTKLSLGQKIKPRDIPFVSRILKEPSRFQSTSEMHRLQDELRAERDRAKRDRTLMPSKLAEVMASGNQLETYRAKQRKVISAMKDGAEKDKAERDLDILIQKWNADARKALLTTEE